MKLLATITTIGHLLSASLITGGIVAPKYGENIPRINYGVNFRFIDHRLPISKIWFHSFLFDIPKLPLNVSNMLVRSDESTRTWFGECLHYWDNRLYPEEKKANQRRDSQYNWLDATKSCHIHREEIITIINNTRKNQRELGKLVEHITDLLPKPITEMKRITRGILNFIGEAEKWLFGTATDGDVKKLSEHVQRIIALTKTETEHIGVLAEHMTSYTVEANKRMNNLADDLKKEALYTSESIKDIATRERSAEFSTQLNLKVTQTNAAMDRTRAHLNSFLTALQLMAGGSLPSTLVSAAMITKAMEEIKQATEYEYVLKTPLEYYKYGKFTYVRFGDKLILNLELPMVMKQHRLGFTAFEIVIIDLIVPNQPTAVTRLKTDVKALAISYDGKWYMELDNFDFLQLKIPGGQLNYDRVYRRTTPEVCLLAIMDNDAVAIKKTCKYQIILDILKPSIQWLRESEYLLTRMERGYAIHCEENSGLSGGNRNGCEQCIIKVPPQCGIKGQDYNTPYEGGIHKEQAEEGIILTNSNYTRVHDPNKGGAGHIVNKALVSHFFSEEELALITGDSIFQKIPDIIIPKIMIHKPNLSVAQDDDIRLNLERSVMAIKADREIIHSTADMILKNQENRPETTQDWGDWMGWLVIGLSILSALMLAQLIYCTIKLRTVSLLVAVMEHHAVSAFENKKDIITLHYGRRSGGENIEIGYTNATGSLDGNTIMNLHLMLSETLGAYVWLILGGLITIIAGLCLRRLARRCKKQLEEQNGGTTIALQFATGEKHLLVKLDKVFALPTDVDIIGNTGPKNIEVKGIIIPKVQFEWNALIIDKFLGRRRKIPQQTYISYWQAYTLEKLLRKFFAANVVLIDAKGAITKVPGFGPVRESSRGGSRLSIRSNKLQIEESPWEKSSAPEPDEPEPMEMSNCV